MLQTLIGLAALVSSACVVALGYIYLTSTNPGQRARAWKLLKLLRGK